MICFIYVNHIRNLTVFKGSKVRFIENFFGGQFSSSAETEYWSALAKFVHQESYILTSQTLQVTFQFLKYIEPTFWIQTGGS